MSWFIGALCILVSPLVLLGYVLWQLFKPEDTGSTKGE